MNKISETLTQKTLGGLNISKVQERGSWLNMLFYGESGVGKTTLAGSADAVPAMHPVIVIDIEGGSESLKHSYPNVEVLRIKTWQQMQDVYNELYDQAKRGQRDFNTVSLDSLNEIQKFSMESIMQKLLVEHPERDIDVPSMREWGKNLEQMRRLVRGFRDLEMHTIFTCLAESQRDEMTGLMHTYPLLTGKFKQEVAALLDVVGFYYMKQFGVGDNIEMKRLLLTQRTDSQVAKDRTGKLPMVIEAPTMEKIYKLMQIQNERKG